MGWKRVAHGAVVTGAGMAVLALTAVLPAHANTAAGLSVAKDAAITLTAKTPTGDLTLCNSSQRQVRTNDRWDGVTLTISGVVETAASLTDVQAPTMLDAAECDRVRVELSDHGTAVVAGMAAGTTASTTLLIASDGAGTVSVPVTFAGGDVVTSTLLQPATPLSLMAYRSGLDGDASLADDQRSIVLDYADSAPDPATVLTGDVALSDGTHRATITLAVDGGARPSAKSVRLDATLSGASDPGTYKGTFTYGPKGANQVPITVIVALSACWLFLIATLGVLVGLLSKLLVGRWRYIFMLYRSRANLYGTYKDIPPAPGTGRNWKLASFPKPTDAVVAQFTVENRTALRRYKKTTVLVDPTAPAYDAMRKALIDAYTDAADYSERLPKALDALDGKVTELVALVTKYQHDLYRPDVVVAAQTVLRLGPPASAPDAPAGDAPIALEVGEATSIADKAESTTALIKAWRDVFWTMLRHDQWCRDIRAADNVDDAAVRKIEQAHQTIGAVMAVLLTASTTDAITATIQGSDFRGTHRTLAVLAEQFHTPYPTTVIAEQAKTMSRTNDRDVAEFAVESDEGSDLRWTPPPFVHGAFVTARHYLGSVGSRTGEWLVVVLQVALAALAAGVVLWQTSYVGKPWGSTSDFLVAGLAGVAASAVIDAVTSGIGWIRGGLASLAK